MTTRMSGAAAILGTCILLATAPQSLGQTVFDMGPEQPGRLHTTAGEAAKAIPAGYDFVQPGKLTMAMSPYLPPTAVLATDNRTVVGVNADLASLIAEKLGLQLDIQIVAFPDWPLGISSGKYDAFIADMTVTEERKDSFDFSTYANDVIGFYVAADSPIGEIDDPSDISGLKVTVSSGTNHESILLEWNRLLAEEGAAPAELQYFDDPTAAMLSLLSGRADASFVNNSEGAYSAATTGQTRLAGLVSGGWPLIAELGVISRKDSGLADAITLAINELLADGTYIATLQRWGVEGEAIGVAKTNPAGLPKP